MSIQTENGVLEDVADVKNEIKLHFSNKFRKFFVVRSSLDSLVFKSLLVEYKEGLEDKFSRKDISEVIFYCEGDISLVPMGSTWS